MKQYLRCSIPSGRNILGMVAKAYVLLCKTKVSQFDFLALAYQKVFWLDVAVHEAVIVAICDTLDCLKHNALYFCFCILLISLGTLC